jgi:Transposase IS4
MAANTEYSPLTPFITRLSYRDGKSVMYEPMGIPPERRHGPLFALPEGIELSVQNLCETFLPDWVVSRIAKSTNAYAASRNRLGEPVTEEEILKFLASFYYMGLVRLPARRDYWKTPDATWPGHPITEDFNRDRFDYIWRNLHLCAEEVQEADEEIEEDEEDEGGDRHIDDGNDDDDDDDDPNSAEEDLPVDSRWFAKCGWFIDHTNLASQSVCKRPGFACSIDEQMRKFKGRSSQTVRMKCKPIKEGYKLFALCDASTGYVYKFEPNGRLCSGSIYDNVILLAESLPQRNRLQYVIAMDNYFTWPKVIEGLRLRNIAVVGTARAKRGWPPKEIKDVDDARFNTLYLLNDDLNFLTARWVDNNIVTMVSTLHTGEEIVTSSRKRPRATAVNRNHLNTVWGNEAKRSIAIPKMIDDYNHWMLGVDKCDQLIAYYRPELRCRRVWMPLFFQCLDIIRVNAYIASSGNDQKVFIQAFREYLLTRARVWEHGRATRARQVALSRKPRSSEKRHRMSHKNPALPLKRLQGEPKAHVMVQANTQRTCVYCSYVKALSKGAGEPLPNPSKVLKRCLYCDVALCKDHFDIYHLPAAADGPRTLFPV